MHAIGIAERHCAARIAVVAAEQRHELALARETACMLVLDGHLRGDLHGDGAGVREEHTVEAGRRELHKSFGKRDRGFVRETAEHHV